VPDVPSYPNRLGFVLVGLVLGLIAGGIACAAAELMDHSIATLGELEAAVPYPVLAAIPHVSPLPRRRSVLGRLRHHV
jgi:capsular polysaccharide biosynthesis protein